VQKLLDESLIEGDEQGHVNELFYRMRRIEAFREKMHSIAENDPSQTKFCRAETRMAVQFKQGEVLNVGIFVDANKSGVSVGSGGRGTETSYSPTVEVRYALLWHCVLYSSQFNFCRSCKPQHQLYLSYQNSTMARMVFLCYV